MKSGPTLFLATANRGKIRELSAILSQLPVQLVTLADQATWPEVVEDGRTFEENARKKALHYHRLTGCLTLADDSGLEVDALDGAPGVFSARFAGPHGDDAANNAKLVALLRDVPLERRTARFHCVMALADHGAVLAVTHGTVEGIIVDNPAGGFGFGYDPHFWVPALGQTKAQLPLETKNRISHRGQAMRAMLPELHRALTRQDS